MFFIGLLVEILIFDVGLFEGDGVFIVVVVDVSFLMVFNIVDSNYVNISDVLLFMGVNMV